MVSVDESIPGKVIWNVFNTPTPGSEALIVQWKLANADIWNWDERSSESEAYMLTYLFGSQDPGVAAAVASDGGQHSWRIWFEFCVFSIVINAWLFNPWLDFVSV